MRLHPLFLMLLAGLWIAEPFALLPAPSRDSGKPACASCGMKGTCGSVCCCCHRDSGNRSEGHVPGVYAAGCTPDSAASKFFPLSLVKWLPAPRLALTPPYMREEGLPGPAFHFQPVPPTDTPPPKGSVSAA